MQFGCKVILVYFKAFVFKCICLIVFMIVFFTNELDENFLNFFREEYYDLAGVEDSR